MQWSDVGGAIENQDVQTLTFKTIEFLLVTQGQHFLWFG